MTIEMTCPTCGSHDISKNGTTHRGKQNYKCRDCGRQFVEDPQWQPQPKETKALVKRKTLSFSKKLENHMGAIWLFIHDDNRRIRQKIAEQGAPLFSSALH
ncbi:MAG: IS1 family transposase [Leptolyngbyaceae cyanobacterium T60_A2020_046]|nr:IS1 family transposase [Leptolyngbyaceae cyanobacterium T60_A2020_046]